MQHNAGLRNGPIFTRRVNLGGIQPLSSPYQIAPSTGSKALIRPLGTFSLRGEGRKVYSIPNFALSKSLTAPGAALPPVCFMT